ncbi:hypothetical protein DPMN_187524 [Dreissena polymorpha]|uniref:Uncharacterized protein n=1 Tax=Dreissena polymorpha TaxID=45954 RepID=A0A9D4DPX5_DREPO|nr:hypothetical protein DPMN_187524 [Dreissena polymorpha]
MTEEMQTPGTLSATSEHNSAMHDYTDLTDTTSQQHKISTEVCIKVDSLDLEKCRRRLQPDHHTQLTLRNMVIGIVTGSHVTVHAIEAVGNTIIRDIKGKSVFAYKFTRKYRAKSL